MTQPETGKTYEFFLAEIGGAKSTGKNPAEQRLSFRWRGVDVDLDIIEFYSIKNNAPGNRLSELAIRLGNKQSQKTMAEIGTFFKLGMHLFSKLQRHWQSGSADTVRWEFAYDTLASRPPASDLQVSQQEQDKIMKYIAGIQTREAAFAKLNSINPALARKLEWMISEGKVKF